MGPPRPFLLLAPMIPAAWAGAISCMPDGPVLPRPVSIAANPLFIDAAENFSSTLLGIVESTPAEANLSFSLAVVSRDQPDPRVPVWEFHHLSPNNVNGTTEIGRESEYLVGSISKVISDYILLASGVDLETKVVDLLPELGGGGGIRWEDVTLEMLGSHMAGLGPNFGFEEFYYLKDVFELLGFPHIEDSEYPSCGVIELNDDCTKQEFLDGMRTINPVALPGDRPVYSNTAFTLFSFALEAATGKNYTELLDSLVVSPLNLTSTAPSGSGHDDLAVVPPGENVWGGGYGLSVPGGGLVSSVSDLSTLLQGILSRDLPGLTETEIRGWLQPRSYAGNAYTAVGLPWEIFSPPTLAEELGHPVFLRGKGGGAPGYRTQMALADDYGIAFIVLTAGDARAMQPIYESLVGSMLPAIDAVAREQAEARYVGTWISSAHSPPSNCTAACGNFTDDATPVNATVEIDPVSGSLMLASLYRGDSDIIAALLQIWTVGLGNVIPLDGIIPRFGIFPTDVHTKDGKETWQAWWDFSSFEDAAEYEVPLQGLKGEGKMHGICITWTLVDWIHYGGEPLDRVLFERDADTGEVVGMEIPFLRAKLGKASK